jgi:hypothetical protein
VPQAKRILKFLHQRVAKLDDPRSAVARKSVASKHPETTLSKLAFRNREEAFPKPRTWRRELVSSDREDKSVHEAAEPRAALFCCFTGRVF